MAGGDRWKSKRKVSSHVFNFNYIKSKYSNYLEIVNKKINGLPEEPSESNFLNFLCEINSLNTVEMFFRGGD